MGNVDGVKVHRADYLARIRAMFGQLDPLIFTLGLTETWADRAISTIFSSAPGVIAGAYDPAKHVFVNLGFADAIESSYAAIGILRGVNPALKILLAISPLPLAATATGIQVMRADPYSNSVLRVVAEEIAQTNPAIDNFSS